MHNDDITIQFQHNSRSSGGITNNFSMVWHSIRLIEIHRGYRLPDARVTRQSICSRSLTKNIICFNWKKKKKKNILILHFMRNSKLCHRTIKILKLSRTFCSTNRSHFCGAKTKECKWFQRRKLWMLRNEWFFFFFWTFLSHFSFICFGICFHVFSFIWKKWKLILTFQTRYLWPLQRRLGKNVRFIQ